MLFSWINQAEEHRAVGAVDREGHQGVRSRTGNVYPIPAETRIEAVGLALEAGTDVRRGPRKRKLVAADLGGDIGCRRNGSGDNAQSPIRCQRAGVPPQVSRGSD